MSDSADMTTGAENSMSSAQADEGYNTGWLGVIGLAGLAGLMPRNRRDRNDGLTGAGHATGR